MSHLVSQDDDSDHARDESKDQNHAVYSFDVKVTW
jgi:hypothetical protein